VVAEPLIPIAPDVLRRDVPRGDKSPFGFQVGSAVVLPSPRHGKRRIQRKMTMRETPDSETPASYVPDEAEASEEFIPHFEQGSAMHESNPP
jgi:hypothetical protein